MYDGSDIPMLMQNLHDAEIALDAISQDTATAIKTQKFASGSETALKSKYIAKFLKEGHRFDSAKVYGESDAAYEEERKMLMGAFETAEKVIQKHKQAYVHWDTARSLLSMAKQQFPVAYGFTKQFQG